MINILVVEDVEQSRNILIETLKELELDMKFLEADNHKDALLLAKQNKVDIFFIDIRLKESSGYELAEDLRCISSYRYTWIFFLTADKDYMLNAFKKIHCYEYIIKPFDKQEIKATIRGISNKILIEDEVSKTDKKFIFVEVEDIKYKIYIQDIIFIETSKRRCHIQTTEGLYEVARKSMEEIVKMISDDDFAQTHKAYLVNLNYVKSVKKLSKKSWSISFKACKSEVPISYSFRNNVLQYIN